MTSHFARATVMDSHTTHGRISLFLLHLFFLLLNSPASKAKDTAAVRDSKGLSLLRGVKYHIQPAFWGRGGGVTLAARNGSCPLDVAQETADVFDGLPVKFLPLTATDDDVRVGADLNIVFSGAAFCAQSRTWRVADADNVTGRRYITTGGVVGTPANVSSRFRIGLYDDIHYMLVHCPVACPSCPVACQNVGVFAEKRRWLGLNGDPFPVLFKKALS